MISSLSFSFSLSKHLFVCAAKGGERTRVDVNPSLSLYLSCFSDKFMITRIVVRLGYQSTC